MTVVLRSRHGRARNLALDTWVAPATSGEIEILRSVPGPALDLGCGPGRLVVALAELGVPALGVDASTHAVRYAADAGIPVLHRSVFEPLPAEGRWASVLLFDGNIGIGGDPAALLTRVRTLLGRSGRAVVEVDPPGAGTTTTVARLEYAGTATSWFPWAWVDAEALDDAAASARLRRTHWRIIENRWFAVLEHAEAV